MPERFPPHQPRSQIQSQAQAQQHRTRIRRQSTDCFTPDTFQPYDHVLLPRTRNGHSAGQVRGSAQRGLEPIPISQRGSQSDVRVGPPGVDSHNLDVGQPSSTCSAEQLGCNALPKHDAVLRI